MAGLVTNKGVPEVDPLCAEPKGVVLEIIQNEGTTLENFKNLSPLYPFNSSNVVSAQFIGRIAIQRAPIPFSAWNWYNQTVGLGLWPWPRCLRKIRISFKNGFASQLATFELDLALRHGRELSELVDWALAGNDPGMFYVDSDQMA